MVIKFKKIINYYLMTKIFCYGTLQNPSVQLELIGRQVSGVVDSIDGFVVIRDYVDPSDGIAYPRLRANDIGCVYGQILEFTPEEVSVLDEYETSMYRRVNMTTNGGELVQVYFPTVLS